MQVQLDVRGCWSIQKINLHVSKIQQTNVKILPKGESKFRKDYLDYHNHNFFGLEMNLKRNNNNNINKNFKRFKNSALRLSAFKLFMLQWKLMGIVSKNIDEF